MWEWNYAREPFDLKLTLLRLIRKIWVPALAALVGAAVSGGIYYLKETVFGGPAQYERTSAYYVEYGTDPQTGDQYTYINDASWKNWVRTDEFVDRVWEYALEAGTEPERYGVGKDDIAPFLTAALPTDLRVPTSTVATPYPELTRALGEALEKAFVAFGEGQKEIDAVRVVDATEVSKVPRGDRLPGALWLGAALGAFLALFTELLVILLDDSVYIPDTFSFRYQIPALGAVTGKGDDMELTKETAGNLDYVFRDAPKVALAALEPETDLRAVLSLLPGERYFCVPGAAQAPEAAGKLREADKVLLLVKAGARNAKAVEHLLHDWKIQDIKADGALLCHADKRLLQAYRLPGLWGKTK